MISFFTASAVAFVCAAISIVWVPISVGVIVKLASPTLFAPTGTVTTSSPMISNQSPVESVSLTSCCISR